MSLAICVSPAQRSLPHKRERSRASMENSQPPSSPRMFDLFPMPSQASSTCAMVAINRIPVEVFVEIYKHLDLASALCLAGTSRKCAAIFRSHRTAIVLEAIKEDFGPVEDLLQLVAMRPSDLATPWGTWLNKRLRRHNTVLCEGGILPDTWPIGKSGGVCKELCLRDEDVDRLLSICRVVKGWERIYPQYRFHDVPLSKRSLTKTENERLRRALYTWMRYAYYFHGDLPRPLPYVAHGTDVRVNQLRCLSNKRLRELQDLWMTVQDIIEVKLCPSVEAVLRDTDFEMTKEEASRVGWGEDQDNQKVIATMSKLSPEELLHYLDNSHRYTKKRLAQEIRGRHPRFEADTETLGIALSCVYSERYDTIIAEHGAPHHVLSSLWFPSRPLGDCRGGILELEEGEGNSGLGVQFREMDGLKLGWRVEDPASDVREEVPVGLLDV